MGARGWIIFVVITIGLLGSLVLLSKKDSLDVSTIDTSVVQTASEQNGTIGDRILGNPDASVVLIEYGDFQCPGCASAHPRIKSVIEKYSSDVLFIFRNFPLTSIHPNAKAASAAAEAAGLQDKYWEMHDKLYENQSAWNNEDINKRTDVFIGYASELGLDQERFKNDLASENITSKINFDLALGKKDGVDGTPYLLLNGNHLDNDVWGDEAILSQAVQDALDSSK